MKLPGPFSQKNPQNTGKPPLAKTPAKASKPDGQRMIIVGAGLLIASFAGTVFLLYFSVNSQAAKESRIQDLRDRLVTVATEKELAHTQMSRLESQFGKVIDLDKVIETAEKVHGSEESARKEGSMWINRKSRSSMITLGALNGVSLGSRLGIYDGSDRLGTVSVISALDVVSYVEPVDISLGDLSKDYYAVRVE